VAVRPAAAERRELAGPAAPRGVDAHSAMPLYVQVEALLRERISGGEWRAGERIPTEEQLGAAYGVSRVTMRQALARLVDRGLLVRERGRGTFVRDTRLTAGARGVTSFTAEMAAMGVTAGSRVLGVEVAPCDPATADALAVADGTPVVVIRRLRTGGGVPIGVQTSRLLAARFPGLDGAGLEGGSLYALLRERYNVTPVEAVETFTVGGVTEADAALLEVAPGAPAFTVERVTFDARAPFERTTSVMRGDQYRIRLVLRDT
jgi:GntR family transcriptional regulator